ncbi:hypothetical protein PMAYCL1PPCAC_23153, partial [Pristionchus mayeri]
SIVHLIGECKTESISTLIHFGNRGGGRGRSTSALSRPSPSRLRHGCIGGDGTTAGRPHWLYSGYSGCSGCSCCSRHSSTVAAVVTSCPSKHGHGCVEVPEGHREGKERVNMGLSKASDER